MPAKSKAQQLRFQMELGESPRILTVQPRVVTRRAND